MDTSIKEQLEKIARLAESGIGGERDNARQLLDRLCKKHRIAPETLLSAETKRVRFLYRGELEKKLLLACYFFVLRKSKVNYWPDRRGGLVFELSEAERIDLGACWTHYRKAWNAHLEDVRVAFICKHQIYGPPSDEKDSDPIDPEKLARILALARGVGGQTWQRPAAALTA